MAHQRHPGVVQVGDGLLGPVGAAVVHHDHSDVHVALSEHGVQRPGQQRPPVVRRNDHRHLGHHAPLCTWRKWSTVRTKPAATDVL